MQFWKKLAEALKQKGFSSVQIKKLQEMFGRLDAAGLLRLSQDQLLAAMTGRTVAEKRAKIETLLAAVREVQENIEPSEPEFDQDGRTDLFILRLAEYADELKKVGIHRMRDLKTFALSSSRETDTTNLPSEERLPLVSLASLTKLFSPEIAVVLYDAGFHSREIILESDETVVINALREADFSDARIRHESNRIQALKKLIENGRELESVSGLDLDGIDFLTDAQYRQLRSAGVDTLDDWAAFGRELKFPDELTRRLDSHSRLFALGVNTNHSKKMIEQNIESALDLSRLNQDERRNLIRQSNINAEELNELVFQAQMRTGYLVGVIDYSNVKGVEESPAWFTDIVNGGFKPDACHDCLPENSALSRFAYLVYLIQRSSLTLDELNEKLDNGYDIREISQEDSRVILPDPESDCATISVLDLIIRQMQELLDRRQANRPIGNSNADYSYLDFGLWRAERLAYFHPELEALWRNDILTGSKSSPHHGSILVDASVTRHWLQEQIKMVRTSLAGAKLALNRNSAPNNLTPNHFNNLPSLASGSPMVHSVIHSGLQIIEQILEADSDVEKAVLALTDEQPGLAMTELNRALSRLVSITREVFQSTSSWIDPDTYGESLQIRLLEVPPPARANALIELWHELLNGTKKLFSPKNSDFRITGLYGNGAIYISEGWHIAGHFIQDGFRVSTTGGSGSSYLRYIGEADEDYDPYTNCRFSCDIVIDDGFEVSTPSRWFGIGVRMETNFGNNQRPGSGVRVRVRRTASNNVLADVLELQSFQTDSTGFNVETLTSSQIGFRFGSDDDSDLYGSIDSDDDLLEPGRRYRLELKVIGNQIEARFRVSATKTVSVSESFDGNGVGTFGFMTSGQVQVTFDQVEFEIEGGPSDTPPFYTARRPVGSRHKLDKSLYNDHNRDGNGMILNDLHQLPLVSDVSTTDPLAIRLHGLSLPGSGGDQHYLVFNKGSKKVDLGALDYLLDRLLGATFYQRFAVIPTLKAEVFRQQGNYTAAAKQLHLLYDDGPDGDDWKRHMYPEFAKPEDSFYRKISPDARLIRLRLGQIYLEHADLLYRQNTQESRHSARLLYRRLLRLHDNPGCDCEGRIGTITESVMDRILKILADIPDEQFKDDPSRFADLIDRLYDLEGQIKIDEILEIFKQLPQNGDNIDPVPELNVWHEKVITHLDHVEHEYSDHVRNNGKIDTLVERGDKLIREAELQMVGLSVNRPLDEILNGNAKVVQKKESSSGMRRIGFGSSGSNRNPFSGEHTHWSLINVTYPPFCVPTDPMKVEQIKTACLHLDLLTNCYNILGYNESLIPSMRFESLLQYARFYADQAAATERDFFQTRQSFEKYLVSIREAEQALKLSSEEMLLESQNVDLARSEVRSTQIQHLQTNHHVNHYQGLINTGLSDMEELSLNAAWTAATFSGIAAGFSLAAAAPALVSSGVAVLGLVKMGTGVLAKPGAIVTAVGALGTLSGDLASGFSSIANAASATSSAAGIQASFERRAQQWEFQHEQGLFNLEMMAEKVYQSLKRLDMARRREEIARLKKEFAADTIRFLDNKFFNRDMWRWLQINLRDQYRLRLHFAISAGFMAESALAFETQNKLKGFIRFDYYQPSRDGLLGSSQLQTDLSQMEFTRISNKKRKLQLKKVLSMAELFPIQFEKFKSGSGVLPFSTAMGRNDSLDDENTSNLELFDRDFPGHYLRLIRSVKVTVIALVPPHNGIRASLTNSGISQVVTAIENVNKVHSDSDPMLNTNNKKVSESFKQITITRPVETIALTSPFDSSGVFQLDHKDDLLMPFEGLGVATDWVFEMPKAANQIDYRSIADVLITIEYTALESPAYRQQVIQQLDNRVSADRSFSFRHQFTDAWHDLHHPDLVEDPQMPMQVSFNTRQEDFPPNVSELGIEHITLYFALKEGVTDEFSLELNFNELGENGTSGGTVVTTDRIAGTRQGNTGNLTTLIGKSPIGEWTLTLEDTQDTRQLFEEEQIEDILFVITFGGESAGWP